VRIDVGNTDTYTISSLTEGATSFCTVTAYNPAKVESAYSNEISVHVSYAAPVVSFSATPASGTAPLQVAFDNNTSGRVTSWAWDFGDGATSNLENPTHVYSTPGTYTASLTATGPGGAMTSSRAISATPRGGTWQGLVAAYAFNEGAGNTVADASGNGNTGTIDGASWTTQGRVGAALSFNGLDSMVKIPPSASLNLSGAMTLEAWIFPTAAQSGWRTIVQREVDAYFLHASHWNGALVPAGGGTFNGDVEWIAGPSAVPVNAWTHVALTYNGAILRLYLNGAQVASEARSGAIQTNSNQISIGGNMPYGEFFQGRIDEVRVYNRALDPAEIDDDMNSAVAP
jgi:PKD repeat protein